MNEQIAAINQSRNYWHNKLSSLLESIMLASLEQNNELHESLLEEFETTSVVLWYWDRKLKEEKALIYS